MFKKRRSIKKSYNEQGLIHFICVNVKKLPIGINTYILNLCCDVAGEHYQILYALMTDDTMNVSGIATKYNLSESQLYVYRKIFYEKWDIVALFKSVITDRGNQL